MKRKILLINPRFQWEVINFIAFLYILISALFYLANFILIKKIYNFGIDSNIPTNSIYFSFVDELRYYGIFYYLIIFIIGMLIIYSLGFFLSHRIAGPIYKISITADKIMQEISDEERSKIKIITRSSDYFPEHVIKMNDLINFYENKIKEIKDENKKNLF